MSVVVGSVESRRSISACLRSVLGACRGVDAEVLLVDASRDGTARIARSGFPEVRVLEASAGTLVPELWARGIRASRGRYVALTIGHCVVPEGWAVTLLEAMDDLGVGGAGAGLELGGNAGIVDWATYFLRYARFASAHDPSHFPVDEIPADNAIYMGPDVRSYLDRSRSPGFWEVDFHEELRAEGRSLRRVPRARAVFGPSSPFGTITRHRFRHGHHSGRWRVTRKGTPVWRVVIPAPVVPPLLLARSFRAVAPRAGHLLRLTASAPVFLVLATAWALGEAAGALSTRGTRDP